jgi:hypothetical protein
MLRNGGMSEAIKVHAAAIARSKNRRSKTWAITRSAGKSWYRCRRRDAEFLEAPGNTEGLAVVAPSMVSTHAYRKDTLFCVSPAVSI